MKVDPVRDVSLVEWTGEAGVDAIFMVGAGCTRRIVARIQGQCCFPVPEGGKADSSKVVLSLA